MDRKSIDWGEWNMRVLLLVLLLLLYIYLLGFSPKFTMFGLLRTWGIDRKLLFWVYLPTSDVLCSTYPSVYYYSVCLFAQRHQQSSSTNEIRDLEQGMRHTWLNNNNNSVALMNRMICGECHLSLAIVCLSLAGWLNPQIKWQCSLNVEKSSISFDLGP